MDIGLLGICRDGCFETTVLVFESNFTISPYNTDLAHINFIAKPTMQPMLMPWYKKLYTLFLFASGIGLTTCSIVWPMNHGSLCHKFFKSPLQSDEA